MITKYSEILKTRILKEKNVWLQVCINFMPRTGDFYLCKKVIQKIGSNFVHAHGIFVKFTITPANFILHH